MKFPQLTVCVLFATFLTTDSQTTAPFKACATPDFDWATYSTSISARMYGMRGAVSDGYVFAAGFVKSTIDASTPQGVETPGKFAITGPYSVSDPTGTNSQTVSVDLQSYTTEEGAKENAGGTWGQYEVGVAKINAATGTPEDFFVYEGHGLDETTGLDVTGGVFAISGHFTGNLTAVLVDGTSKTIWNSNVAEGTSANNTDQFHPNTKDTSKHTGVDDGFVIKARVATGEADWIVRYPESNKDAQIVDVNVDESGNVFGAGYKCTLAEGADLKVCDGVIAMFASTDGTVVWETILPQLGAAFRTKHDAEDNSLYIAGTTTFSGFTNKDGKDNPLCEHDTCSVVMRLSATDGAIQWERTLQGSPRWGVFGQNGGVGVASEADGPYVYVAIDDTGEDTATSVNAGTPYSGCKAADGTITPEYEVLQNKVLTADDCPANSTFVARNDIDAFLASSSSSQAMCGAADMGRACVIKYHKYTGLPMWATDVPDVAGIVPSPDGTSVHIGGWYSSRGGIPVFGDVKMPEYLREQALDGKSGGVWNAKLSAQTGIGEYAMSSGGGNKDRLNDMVGDSEGNIYNIGYHQNLVFRWGNNLETTMVEGDGTSDLNADNPTQALDTQLTVSKMSAATENVPSCLTECSGNTDQATIEGESCFIDGKCYAAGASTVAFGKPCFICDPTVSQREWTEGPTIGTTECFIGGTCVNSGDIYYYQRRAWNSPRVYSECQICDPTKDAKAWSVVDGYAVNATLIPPKECSIIVSESETEEVVAISKSESSEEETVVPNNSGSSEEEDITAKDAESENSSMGGGAIAGIAIGAVVGVGLIVAAGVKFLKSDHLSKEYDGDYGTQVPDDKSSIASGV